MGAIVLGKPRRLYDHSLKRFIMSLYFRGSDGFVCRYQRTYARWIWEQHHGEIPAGYTIHHKDGNRINDRIENLMCIPAEQHRAIHGLMAE